MNDCPACLEETAVAAMFPTLDTTGCLPGKVRTAPAEQLCDEHRADRARVDAGDRNTIDRLGGYARRLLPGYELKWKEGPMLDPKLFGRELERLMAGDVDEPFWRAHLDELTPCQLGAAYVALRMGKQRRHDLLEAVVASLGLSEPWVVSGR